MTIKFDDIKRNYPLNDIVAASGERLTKNGDEWEACCPFHGEKTPSFRVYRDKVGIWKYHCFGCGAHGDSVDYVKERYGMETTGEAARFITGENADARPVDKREYREATNAYDGYDIGRPPAGTPPILAGEKTPGILNPKRVDPTSGKPKMTTYKPSMVFPYRNKFGELIGYILRVDFDDKKITPGVWWTTNKAAGFEGWSHGSLPAPRPMYGLPELYENPEHQVLIVEGEKCKDAAARLMAGKRVVPVTWPGGGKSMSKVYWGSLKGRSIIIWPDNDVEGWKTAMGWPDERGGWHKGVVDYAFEAGASTIKIVHITPESRPKGWDIADAEKEGLGQRGVELLMRERIQAWPRKRFDEWKKRAIDKAMPGGNDNDPGPEDNGGGNGGASPGGGEGDRPGQPAAASDNDNAGRSDSAPTGHRSEAEREGESREPILVGRGFDISEDTWRQHLIMKADGDGLKANSLQNFALLLQYERRFAGIFAWNEFAKEVYLQRRPPWDITGNPARWRPRPMTEPDVTSTACWLEYCGMNPKTNEVGKVIQRVAQHNTYNPVVEALESFVWDGVPRLSGKNEEGDYIAPWLTRYMGAADSNENKAFGRKWMVGAVARAMQPGCKVDTMIVFEGGQGLKKSTALRVIADAVCPGVFTDEISDPNSKDAGLQMQGAFIIEISELDAFRRAEITQIKAWLSRQTDRFRRPYGKIIEEFPRSCVFAGTVNPIGIGYLKDPSGARRMWPVEVTKIEIEALAKDAQQLWAEAVAAYKDGEQWWLDEDENVYAQIAQQLRYEEDPYGQMIDEYVITRTQVTTLDVMESCLKIEPERRSAIVNRRIASHLHSKGWERINDDGRIYYVAPSRMV
jgi:predicted P-loop ATPase